MTIHTTYRSKPNAPKKKEKAKAAMRAKRRAFSWDLAPLSGGHSGGKLHTAKCYDRNGSLVSCSTWKKYQGYKIKKRAK